MNEVQLYRVSDMQTMARAMSKTGMFGFKTEDQAFALMLVAQAEGKHPATIAQDYDVIQGRPALKSVAALSRFQHAGGRIDWLIRNDVEAEATFTHALGGSVTIAWDKARAEKAQLWGKDNWRKFPGQMLAARVVAEGVRACFPACLNGFYLAEEVQDFEPRKATSDDRAPIKGTEVSQEPPPEVDPADRDAIAADLKALGVTRDQIVEVMGATKWANMTAEQYATLDQMRHAIQSQNHESTTTEEEGANE